MALAGCAAPEGAPAAAAPAPPATPPPAAGAPAPRYDPLPVLDLPLSVEEAYAAIPHRRTVFRFDSSPLGVAETAYLRQMFAIVEQGTRIRVVAWRDLHGRDATGSDPAGTLLALIRRVEAIRPPPRLEAYHAHVRAALAEQRAFFLEWIAAGAGFRARSGAALAADPRVQRASAELRAAYQVLMQEYGSAVPQQERDAFFDYHCALDFL